MAKFEKEIKILNINVKEIQKKLESIKATFKGEKNQKIFTYDVPTLYYRFLEIKELLNSDNELLFNTNLIKLQTLCLELQDLVSDDDLNNILKQYNLKSLETIVELPKNEIINLVQSKELEELFKDKLINPNKWVRLRKSNDKVELTVKHVFEKEHNNIQSVLETEINTNSLEETNLLLEGIGLARRNYQEKNRISYTYKTAEIEIDIWPLLNPYIEIECDDENVTSELIELLNLQDYEIVSLNTSELYRRKGIDIQNMSELKFTNEE